MIKKKKKFRKASKKEPLSINLRKFSRSAARKLRVLIMWFLVRVSILFVAVLLTATTYFYTTIPSFETILDGRSKGSVTLLDRYGQTFAWRGKQLDSSLRSTKAAKHLVNAIISAEDRRFFSHFGVSFRGILGAIRINIMEGRHPLKGHGGSTITQQVAKLLCFMQKVKLNLGADVNL